METLKFLVFLAHSIHIIWHEIIWINKRILRLGTEQNLTYLRETLLFVWTFAWGSGPCRMLWFMILGIIMLIMQTMSVICKLKKKSKILKHRCGRLMHHIFNCNNVIITTFFPFYLDFDVELRRFIINDVPDNVYTKKWCSN